MKKYIVLFLVGLMPCITLFASSATTSISLFNAAATSITVGTNPKGLAITSNGQYLYVANAGSNSVSVINTATNVVVKIITGFDNPNSVTINSAGTKAYVTNSKYGGANSVSVIDINSSHVTTYNTVVATITGFNAPCAMVITSDGLFGYVANYGNPANLLQAGISINRVNLTTNAIVGAAIPVGIYPNALAISSDGSSLYVANYGNPLISGGSVVVVDIDSSHTTTFNTVIKTITGFFGPSGIAMTPNGLYAYVVNYGNNPTVKLGSTVSVIDLNSANTTYNTIVQTITVGTQPAGIAINAAGNYAFVTLYNQGNVGSLVTIQLSNDSILAPSFLLGKGPKGIVVAPNGLFLYAANYDAKSVFALSFANTFAVSVFNLSSSIGLYLSNMFINTLNQTIGYLTSNLTLTPTQYSAYCTVAQLMQTPGCTGLSYNNQSGCNNVSQNVRVFLNGGSNTTNFYYDIPYTNIPSGPTTLNVDFSAATAQVTGGTAPTAQLLTSTGNSTVTGTQYTLNTNIVYSDAE